MSKTFCILCIQNLCMYVYVRSMCMVYDIWCIVYAYVDVHEYIYIYIYISILYVNAYAHVFVCVCLDM